MQEYYKILRISENATNEEVELAYQTLKEKYSRERFYEGEVGNNAARQLTKVETAYHEIMEARKKVDPEQSNADYVEIDLCIKRGDINRAQELLDEITYKNAEWHYLQSVIFYKKNWINDSKIQLEIALSKEPHNTKYAEDYARLKQKIEYMERQFKSGNTEGFNGQEEPNRQMGGSDANNCLSFCATWCCIDMMCSLCCR